MDHNIYYLEHKKKTAEGKISRYLERYLELEVQDILGTLKKKWELRFNLDKHLWWTDRLVQIEKDIEEMQDYREKKRKLREEGERQIQQKREQREEKRVQREEKRVQREEKKRQIQQKREQREEKKRQLQQKRAQREEKRAQREEKRAQREEKKRKIQQKKLHAANRKRAKTIKNILKEKWVHIDEKISKIRPLLEGVELGKLDKIEYIHMTDRQNLPDFDHKILSDDDKKGIEEFRFDVCAYIAYFYLQRGVDPYIKIKQLEFDLFDGDFGYVNTRTGIYYFKDELNNIQTIEIPVKHMRNFDIMKRNSCNSFVYDKSNVSFFMKKIYHNLSIKKEDYLIEHTFGV